MRPLIVYWLDPGPSGSWCGWRVEMGAGSYQEVPTRGIDLTTLPPQARVYVGGARWTAILSLDTDTQSA